MYVLGIHLGHDSSCAIVCDGQVIAAVAEERFTRLKHYSYCPVRSLEFCLKYTGLSLSEVDLVVIPSITGNEVVDVLLGLQKQGLFIPAGEFVKKDASYVLRYIIINILKKLGRSTPIEPPIYVPRFSAKPDTEMLNIEHHLAHAASAYYGSGFRQRTLVLTADGSGDGLSLTVWLGKNGVLAPLSKIGRDGSLGAFYSTVTEALGWWVGDGEGKTMGLAPYGNTKKTRGRLDFIRPHFRDGKLVKKYDWGFPSMWQDSGSEHWHFAKSDKIFQLLKKYEKEDIAAEGQRVLEEELLGIVKYWIGVTSSRYLAAAGGVFLNVKANQRIWGTGLLKDFYIYPDAGDSGLSVGAALYGYYSKNKEAPAKKITSIYWGPSYSNTEIEELLRIRRIKFKYYSGKKLVKLIARYLAEGKIIGWFQGRMEVGPRALGNRSILMDPRKARHKDIINKRIKYREPFRPFCPSILADYAKHYLENIKDAPFMIQSFDVKKNKIGQIPAVVHIDGTARPQFVTRKDNRLFYELLENFYNKTGVPVLLNTSFNTKGEPIVCNPQDAIKCFYDTGMDCLVLGNFLIRK